MARSPARLFVTAMTMMATKAKMPNAVHSASEGLLMTRRLVRYGEMPVPKDQEKLKALVSLLSRLPSAPLVIQLSTWGQSMLMKKP